MLFDTLALRIHCAIVTDVVLPTRRFLSNERTLDLILTMLTNIPSGSALGLDRLLILKLKAANQLTL